MKTTPKLKPRRMWVAPEIYALPGKGANVFSREKCFPTDAHVAVIPLDDVPGLIATAAAAHYRCEHEGKSGLLTNGDCMTAALTAIGVLPRARKGSK